MSWASGIDQNGREVGYAVDATCDHPECQVEINRGLSYICGSQINGGEYGCGKFFCEQHRKPAITGPANVSLCERCLYLYEVTFPDDDE